MTIPFSIMPPQNWQDFEEMVLDFAKITINNDFDKHGRSGQAQNGVDIFGHDTQWKNIGIQCKHRIQYDSNGKIKSCESVVTNNDIDDELLAAEKFSPKLDKFIIATTSLRDTKIQSYVNELNDMRKGKRFLIDIWFWEKFQAEFNKHSSLMYSYYSNFLEQANVYDKDIHIICFIKKTLMRPAFCTEFHLENSCEDFISAISDTQKAINTGYSLDRDENILRTSFDYGELSRVEWKERIELILQLLQKTRDCYTQALKDDSIRQYDNSLDIRDHLTSNKLNRYRSEILHTINCILNEIAETPIDSPLLRRQYSDKEH